MHRLAVSRHIDTTYKRLPRHIPVGLQSGGCGEVELRRRCGRSSSCGSCRSGGSGGSGCGCCCEPLGNVFLQWSGLLFLAPGIQHVWKMNLTSTWMDAAQSHDRYSQNQAVLPTAALREYCHVTKHVCKQIDRSEGCGSLNTSKHKPKHSMNSTFLLMLVDKPIQILSDHNISNNQRLVHKAIHQKTRLSSIFVQYGFTVLHIT